MKILWASATTLLVFATAPVQADGIVHRLPVDGSWVTYLVESTETDANNSSDVKRATGSLTIASVGTETVDGKKCRWIEIQGTIKQENRTEEELMTIKMLIPEKHLKKGGNPGKNVIRGWRQRGWGKKEGKVSKLDVSDPGPLSWVLDGLLAGPDGKTEKVESKKIEFQQGELNCPGVTGTFVYFIKAGDEKREMSGTMTTRFHEKVPFGVASLEVDTKEPSGDFIEINFVLNDYGKGAKSRLPDHK